jgi:hypothetical protein
MNATRLLAVAALAAVPALGLAACKGTVASGKRAMAKVFASPPADALCAQGAAVATRVHSGDTIRGHLYPDQGCQCFFFDGVESSLLDLEISTDVGNEAAPSLEISGPDGRLVDLRPELGPEGSAVQRAKGIVLSRTGTYRVSVCKKPCDPEHYWKFTHTLSFAPPCGQALHLSACAPQRLSFTAPEGARVLVRVSPASKTGVVPTVVSVQDPDGGRALDPASAGGAPPPQIGRSSDGTMVLDFPSAKAGRYTVHVGSEGGEGPASATVSVVPAPRPRKDLYHGGWPCPETPGALPGGMAFPAPAATTHGVPPPAPMPVPGAPIAHR